VNVKALQVLPKQLRFFESDRITGEISSFDFWPSTLTHLEFAVFQSEEIGRSDARWASLPKSLTHLKVISDGDYLLEIDPTLLPPLVKNASGRLWGLQRKGPDFSHLHGLSFLTIFLHHPPNGTIVDPTLQVDAHGLLIDSLQSSSPSSLPVLLPKNLLELTWAGYNPLVRVGGNSSVQDRWYFRDSWASSLPASLRSFSCDDARLLTNHFVAMLPNGLHSLQLQLKAGYSTLISGVALQSLPPQLTKLSLDIDENSDDSFIPYLPRSLTHLNLGRIQTVNDSTVQYLPRDLQYLCMPNVAHGLSDGCLPLLPTRMKSLLLAANQTFTPEAFFACGFLHLELLLLTANRNFTKERVSPFVPHNIQLWTGLLSNLASTSFAFKSR
jgi:hypothetical protein